MTPKPPRCFSSIGISMTSDDWPAVRSRRSTGRPSRSISREIGWPGRPEAAKSRAVWPTGTELASASSTAARASGVFSARDDELPGHLEVAAELVARRVEQAIRAAGQPGDRDARHPLLVMGDVATRDLGAAFPARQDPRWIVGGVPARTESVARSPQSAFGPGLLRRIRRKVGGKQRPTRAAPAGRSARIRGRRAARRPGLCARR